MSAQSIVLFIVPCVFIFGISVNGNDCQSSMDCKPKEFCDHGSCRCSKGYVKYIEKCFPIKSYGEECSHDIQCNDYRMICTNDENDVQQKMFCTCDPYHLWNATSGECLEISNITQIAGNFREVHNVSGMIERSAQKVFLGVVAAGIIFVSILLSFIGICSIYGCCRNRKKGSDDPNGPYMLLYMENSKSGTPWNVYGLFERYGENDLGKSQINEVAIIGLPSGTYEAVETDFSAMASI